MKAIFSNLKLAIFVYLLVLLLCTLFFVFIPKGLKSQVEMLQQSVQSKQLLVNTLRSHPQKKTFVMPKEAPDWLKQLPPEAEVNRSLIQLNDLFNQTGVQFESISLQDASNSNSQNAMQQVLNDVAGRGGQNQPQNLKSQLPNPNQGNQIDGKDKDTQTVKTVTFNLTFSGRYYSVLDFFYQLVHADRLFRIDSLQISQQKASDSFGSVQSYTQPPSLSQQPAPQTQSNLKSQVASQQVPAVIQNNQPNAQPILPVEKPTEDKISVTMSLTAFYMPDASFLGSLPPIQTYPPEKRKNPFAP